MRPPRELLTMPRPALICEDVTTTFEGVAGTSAVEPVPPCGGSGRCVHDQETSSGTKRAIVERSRGTLPGVPGEALPGHAAGPVPSAIAAKTARMVVDPPSSRIVKQLATKLKKEVRRWGDTIKHSDALTIVARMFGHDGYEELHSRLGLADVSEADARVDAEEAAMRYKQYVSVLSENDFSVEEAMRLLDCLSAGRWWNFSSSPSHPDHSQQFPIRDSNIKVAATSIEFVDLRTAKTLFGVFRQALRAGGHAVDEGPRHLFAKMFGHSTFNRLLDAAGLGNPSVPDVHLGPDAFDQRVRGYLATLSDAGIRGPAAMDVLRQGFEGWLGIEEDEWESLRQPRHANRLESGRRPRWRPRTLRSGTGQSVR